MNFRYCEDCGGKLRVYIANWLIEKNSNKIVFVCEQCQKYAGLLKTKKKKKQQENILF